MVKPPQVLLVTQDPRRRQAWEQVLHQHVEFGTLDAATQGADAPEVVITDLPSVQESLAAYSALLLRGEIGIIAVDARGPADVSLPADYTPRELRLACCLLVEIVRLRRRRTEDKRAQRALQLLAFRDALTDLSNRRTWDTQLATRLEELRAGAGGRGACVALLDLDQFKLVNDRLGHQAGDDVLRTVGSRLKQGVRERDAVARVGGDEFAVVLSPVDADQAAQVVERIRQSVAQLVGDPPGPGWQLTASAGFITVAAGTNLMPQDAMAAADRSLRQAKAEGRDRTIGGPYRGA